MEGVLRKWVKCTGRRIRNPSEVKQKNWDDNKTAKTAVYNMHVNGN